jgi:repressor LexA
MHKLKELRTRKGLYQKDVASYLGVDRTTYVRYEKGTSEPSYDILCQLAVFFDVSVDYLLGKDSPENPQKKELFDIVNGMSDDELKQFKEYAEYLISRR